MSNTPKKPVQAPSAADRKRDLMRYDVKQFPLIPLHKPKATRTDPNGKVRQMGKAPLDAKWTTKKYDSAKVRADAIADRRNVGVCLTDDQLVIDVDPRNGGEAGFAALCHDIGIDGDAFPRVITGSGGWHCYASKPADVLVRDTLESDEYSGVEFKSRGRQVVAAGSIHPNGNPYYWSPDHPAIEDGLPKVPTALINVIKRPAHDNSNSGGDHTPAEVAAKLAKLDPNDYDTNDKWFPIMCGSFDASGGDARQEFIEWSVGGDGFEKDAYAIGKRWDSLHMDRANKITAKTLDWHVNTNGDPSKIVAAEDDFDDLPTDDPDDFMKGTPDAVADDPDDFMKGATDAADTADDKELSDAQWANVVRKAGEHGYKTMPMRHQDLKVDAMLDHCDRSFAKAKAPLFQMAGRIVHPVRTEKPSDEADSIKRPSNALLVRGVNDVRLQMYMIQHAPFFKIIRPPNGKPVWTLMPAPMKLASQYIAREDKRGLRPLTGIIETPTLRRDGTLLQKSGYDEASGLLLDLGNVKFPKVPEKPTREQALKALEFLKRPFKDFPFVPDMRFAEFDSPEAQERSASRSVMLSGMLTAVVRRSLPTAPIHGVTAPQAGTGKTLAIQCVAMMATGRVATATNQGPNDEEDQKRLAALYIDGDPVILIDNCTRPVGGPTLCAILTSEFWKTQILGKTENVSVLTNSLMFYNGNVMRFMDDATRRALLCRMDAKMERPQTRTFDVKLEEWVPANRTKLVACALTIMRAFVVAGRPGLNTFAPLGNFEAWSDLVRGSLIWLGEPDPVATQAHIEKIDPTKAGLGALLAAIRSKYKGAWFTAGELVNGENSDRLHEAIEQAVDKPTRQTVGTYLANREGQIIDGMYIEQEFNKKAKTNRYRVSGGGG